LGKSAHDLTLAEAALLAALPNTPALNPLDAPAAAIENQQQALQQLVDQGWIRQEEYEFARQEEIAFADAPRSVQPFAAAYTDLVLNQLAAQLGQQRIERGGLRIITTLDYEQQLEMTCTARTQLGRLTGLSGQISLPEGGCDAARLLPTLPPDAPQLPGDLSANALLLDLATGEVLAMLGDVNSAGAPVNVSTHQPGSLLSPFIAVTSFARGEGPASLVWDIPPAEESLLAEMNNPDGAWHGPQRMRTALANDHLIALSQLLVQIGPANVWRLAAPFGLDEIENAPNPGTLLFGGGNASLLDVAQAYSTFAHLGSQVGQRTSRDEVDPVLVLKVEDRNGRILLQAGAPETQSILSEQLAYLAHHILNDETARQASLGYPNPLQLGRPTGAKIGQAKDNQQVWTVGYTRSHLIVTWLGWPDSQETPARLDPKTSAGIWYALMQNVSRQQAAEDWPRPAGITTMDVCTPSGLLPTADCPAIASEIFINGSEPAGYDNLHQTYQVNRETGQLATVFTPLELIEDQTYLIVPPEAREWAVTAGIALPPAAYDVIQNPPYTENAHISNPPIFSYVHGTLDVQGTAAGDGFASYQLQVGEGLYPLTWLQIAEGSKPVRDEGTLGTWQTGKDGLYAMRLMVTNEGQELETAIIQVTVDNTPPRLSVPYPTAGQEFSFSQNDEITLQAKAEDAVGIARVEWIINDRLIGETTQMPYSYPWAALPGEYTLVVKAEDLAGNTTESTPITFRVNQ
ncbi:MAG: Ig-like domain-containing protein, partial [Anaerolineaceae bacterium]|nr:Ig-like domain-containing protein [Anaerolineaceae bacterium]